ncbi:MAG: signal transduction histidine kinase [Phenylobacterium sp.]|jgi:signal transduction histidine kinase
MKISLYQRLALALAVLFIAVAGVFFWWSHNLEQLSRNEAEQRLHISLADHLVGDNPLLKQGVYDHNALKNLFHTLMILGPSFEFYFVDTQGKILTYSAEPGKVKREKIDLLPLFKLIEQKQSLPIYGDNPRSTQGKKIFSASAVYQNNGADKNNTDKGNLQGYLYIIIGSDIYDSIFAGIESNQQLAQSAGLLVGVVVFFFVVLLALLRFLTLPLKDLSADMRAFRHAGFEKSKINLRAWPGAQHNEVHELGQAFNDMAEQINYQLMQLQNKDKQRRELLAHLSHDLRTPLASLQGYLETMDLKGTELSEAQHQRFVGIAFRNANQLKRLVDQIFELAHLEGGQVTVNLESFPLGELLYDIAAKFAFKAKEHNIEILVEPQQCSYMVHSDIGKLERVLTNLIDNAIRHSGQGGQIILRANEGEGEKLKLEVVDNGTGISAEELPYVFDARYRASNAIDDQKQHGGLGLAICQKLMLLLQSDIMVKSKLGEGTTFSLSLSKVG